jgi:hypothetical protein
MMAGVSAPFAFRHCQVTPLGMEYPQMTVQGYDIVGDIHGHADALHRLLHELDYAEVEGVFRHTERQMIFVG